MLPGVAFGLSSFGCGAVAALAVLMLHTRDQIASTYVLGVFAVVFLVVRAVGSPLVDTYGGSRIARSCIAVEVVGLVLVAVTTVEALVVLGVALVGAGVALTYPATVSMTLARTSTTAVGTSVGVVVSFWDLGIMAAGLVSGAVAEWAGFEAAFGLAAACAAAAVLVIAVGLRRPRPPRERVRQVHERSSGG